MHATIRSRVPVSVGIPGMVVMLCAVGCTPPGVVGGARAITEKGRHVDCDCIDPTSPLVRCLSPYEVLDASRLTIAMRRFSGSDNHLIHEITISGSGQVIIIEYSAGSVTSRRDNWLSSDAINQLVSQFKAVDFVGLTVNTAREVSHVPSVEMSYANNGITKIVNNRWGGNRSRAYTGLAPCGQRLFAGNIAVDELADVIERVCATGQSAPAGR